MNKLTLRTARWPGAAALALSLLACGGGAGPTAPEPGRDQALAVSQPGDLVRVVQDKLRLRETQRPGGSGPAIDVVAVSAATASATTSATSAAAERSGPLAQEQGVDEADLLQTDGSHLYTLQPAGSNAHRLQVHVRGSDGRATELATVTLPSDAAVDAGSAGLHLSADGRTLALVSPAWLTVWASPSCPAGAACLPAAVQSDSRVEVQRVDVSTPATPAAGDRLSIDGSLVDSRRIGDALYIVTVHRPRLAVDQLAYTASPAQREAAIAATTEADLLPRVRRNGGAAEALVAETDCWVQAANASLAVEITTITVFDLRSPTLARSSRCFLGGTEALYMTPGSLYLATTRYAYQAMASIWAYPSEIKTDLHKFALAAGGLQYRGSGQVQGHLGWDTQRKSYRLSEHNGDLRVLSFTGTTGWMSLADAGSAVAASPALLTVLRERASDQTLQAVATLPNANRPALLGKPGEQVYGVRFVGARGYVVTFRRTDPLYVLDLADPADPRVAGALELAGFSETLVPLDGALLLGVGRDADVNGRVTGLKLALFDVADAAAPRLLSSSTLGGTGSRSALDASRHGLNLLVRDDVARIALPVNLAPAVADLANGASNWRQGLQRYEVDTRARTMVERPMLGGATGTGYADPGLDRSVQIGAQVYYLGGGSLASYDW